MKKFFILLLLSPFVASKEVGYTDYQCGKGFKVFTVRYFDNGILEYEDNVVLRNGLKIKNSEETISKIKELININFYLYQPIYSQLSKAS